jgi:hypothetical protein
MRRNALTDPALTGLCAFDAATALIEMQTIGQLHWMNHEL